jgi:hypothetical protein
VSDTITVSVHGHDFPISPPFTNRELHLIKSIAGVRAGQLFDAMEAGDNDLVVALAHIGIKRAGRHQPTLDALWDMAPGEIEISSPDDEEEGAVPPTSTPTSGGEGGSQATIPSERIASSTEASGT